MPQTETFDKLTTKTHNLEINLEGQEPHVSDTPKDNEK